MDRVWVPQVWVIFSPLPVSKMAEEPVFKEIDIANFGAQLRRDRVRSIMP